MAHSNFSRSVTVGKINESDIFCNGIPKMTCLGINL